MIGLEFMKIYLKYDNMHSMCMHCDFKCSKNHIIARIYCIIVVVPKGKTQDIISIYDRKEYNIQPITTTTTIIIIIIIITRVK